MSESPNNDLQRGEAEDQEPLQWNTDILEFLESKGQHLAKVKVEGLDRMCLVPANIFVVGEKVAYIRPDVDIIFSECIEGYAKKHGVVEGKKPQKIKVSKKGKVGDCEIEGNVLKLPAEGETPAWELQKHISSTPIVGGNFPTDLIRKTNEYNVENKPKLLKPLLNTPVDVTLKMDGQSITFIYQPDKPLMVCTRNSILMKGDPMLDLSWFEERFPQKVDIFPIEGAKDQIFAIQAEHIGEKTNGNLHGFKEDQLFIFNVDQEKRRLNREQMETKLKELIPGFPPKDVHLVPLVKTASFSSLDEIKELAGKQIYDNGIIAEGVIIRDQKDYSKSLKFINNGYEQKKKEIRDMNPKQDKKRKQEEVESEDKAIEEINSSDKATSDFVPPDSAN